MPQGFRREPDRFGWLAQTQLTFIFKGEFLNMAHICAVPTGSHTIALFSNVTNKSGPTLGDFVGQTRDCGSHQGGVPQAVQASGLPASFVGEHLTKSTSVWLTRLPPPAAPAQNRVRAQPAAGIDSQPQEPPRWSPDGSDGSWDGFEKKPFNTKKKQKPLCGSADLPNRLESRVISRPPPL